jgi:hypothetical protein
MKTERMGIIFTMEKFLIKLRKVRRRRRDGKVDRASGKEGSFITFSAAAAAASRYLS